MKYYYAWVVATLLLAGATLGTLICGYLTVNILGYPGHLEISYLLMVLLGLFFPVAIRTAFLKDRVLAAEKDQRRQQTETVRRLKDGRDQGIKEIQRLHTVIEDLRKDLAGKEVQL